MTDAFDCPFPKRETNWTLPKSDRRPLSLDRQTNRTNDIPGASPGTTVYFQARRFQHKPNLFSTADIDGASPARQVPEVVRRGPNDSAFMSTSTIGGKADCRVSMRTCDPLNPSYSLPEVRQRLPTPQKQIRETLKLSDIQGTKPKAFYVRSSIRNTLDSSDIPHSKAGDHQKKLRSSGSLALVNADIMHGPETKLHPRNTNPLAPEYKLFCASGQVATIGDIAGAHPKQAREARKDNILSSLRSDDIEGATPGNSLPYPKNRKNLMPTRWTAPPASQ
jgi:hypothetical protein